MPRPPGSFLPRSEEDYSSETYCVFGCDQATSPENRVSMIQVDDAWEDRKDSSNPWQSSGLDGSFIEIKRFH